jgi:mRNA interferase HigB
MRVIALRTLREFWRIHEQAELPLKAWFQDAKQAEWKTPQDIKNEHANVSILSNNRVVFNIHSNRNRLVVKIHYNTQTVFIRFVGTHREYDVINAETI